MAFTYSWSTIADGAIDPDSPIDTALMTALRNNVVYAYEYVGGKSFTPAEPHNHNGTNSALVNITSSSQFSAGVVNEVAMGASAISQGKLKSTTGDSSIQISGSSSDYCPMLPGGQYGFLTTVFNGTNALAHEATVKTNSVTTAEQAMKVWFTNADVSAITFTARQRYVQASPPYDLGNGPVPLFIFAEVRSDGSPRALYVAPEAPWHYNGPTRICADFYTADGRPMRRVPQIIAEHGNANVALTAGLTRAQWRDRLLTDPTVDQEITQTIKQADMQIIPHPFSRTPASGHSIVLLDPVSPIMERLLALHELGIDESVSDLLYGGHLLIGTSPLPRHCPPGVMAVGCRWKNTP